MERAEGQLCSSERVLSWLRSVSAPRGGSDSSGVGTDRRAMGSKLRSFSWMYFRESAQAVPDDALTVHPANCHHRGERLALT